MKQPQWDHHRKNTRDASGLRAVEWYDVTKETLGRYSQVRRGDTLWQLKMDLHCWFVHKHAVLQDALYGGVILEIDVHNAVVCDCFFSKSSQFLC